LYGCLTSTAARSTLDCLHNDLDNYRGCFVWWWSFAGFLLGVIWMLYWTLTKRTAADIRMITPRDHMWINVLAGLTLAPLIVGWVYSASTYPVRLPQQTAWFAPKPLPGDQNSPKLRPKQSGSQRRTADFDARSAAVYRWFVALLERFRGRAVR
jgi:hypothetical protein